VKTRALTAAAVIPLVLVAVFLATPWPLCALAFVAAAIGSAELAGLLGRPAARMPLLGLGCIGLAAAYLAGAFSELDPGTFAARNAGLLAAGVLGAALLIAGQRSRIVSEAASLWIAAPLAALALLHEPGRGDASGPWEWRQPLLLALVPIWIGDTAGILVGKALGRIPFAPQISPNKTWEGAIANLIGCALGGLLIARLLGVADIGGLACGVACGVLGQAGDLFQSALKRSVGKKDSGSLLPGHGGILDRMDSLLFAGPAVATLLWYFPALFQAGN